MVWVRQTGDSIYPKAIMARSECDLFHQDTQARYHLVVHEVFQLPFRRLECLQEARVTHLRRANILHDRGGGRTNMRDNDTDLTGQVPDAYSI